VVIFSIRRKHKCDTAQIANFDRGVDNELNVTEELAGLMAVKGTTVSEDLHEEMKNMWQKLNIPILK
jgi:hypothetical protein